MDAKPHYFKIGIFVLIAVALIVVAVVIFGAGLLAQDELLFESYFAESITGLTVGSPVEFRGVRMGQVTQIGFVGNIYHLAKEDGRISPYALYVRVVTSIPRSKMPEFATGQVERVLAQMVERGARVRVTSNLLTGQAFLEMNYLDPNRYPVERVPWEPRYPRIPSATSELTTIKDSIDKILTQLQTIDVEGLAGSMQKLLTSLDTAITDANLAELSSETRALIRVAREKIDALQMEEINASAQQFLTTLNQTVTDANIPQLSRQTRGVLTELDRKLAALDVAAINRDLQGLMQSLDRAVADANVPALSREALALMSELRSTNQSLGQLLATPDGMADKQPSLPEVVNRLSQTIAQLNKVMVSSRPEIAGILNDLRDTVDSLSELVSSLSERPSQLLFSNPPRESEVLE